MNYFVEIAQVVNGQVASVKTLSRRREWRAGAIAAGFALAAFAAGFTAITALHVVFHRVVNAPFYIALWAAVATVSTALAWHRARSRAQRYVVGAGIDDDAFASTTVDLVQGGSGGVGLTVVPGMSGLLFGGRSPVALESLVHSGRSTRVPLGAGARAEIDLDATRFVVSVSERRTGPVTTEAGAFKPVIRPTMLALQLAAVASLFCGMPGGNVVTEADMRSSVPANATPWEVEKLLRQQAQLQARSLHQCFDVLPMKCQRPGYVGVGVALDKSGEIRSNWIARSTYTHDCPVESCMSEVISKWFFEPVPESIRVILPVQVLRTDRPLPPAQSMAAMVRPAGAPGHRCFSSR
ncbi:MAG TPA: hypothetical protein VNO55_22750 [Polyangia bacterium]|nr:hypothetical protein [Polyangia bacterium]